MLLTADAVVTGREVLRPGWIEISGARVSSVGSGMPPGPADSALGAVTVVPGFVDTHVHGGGGFDFSTADPGGVAAVVDLHRSHGTTTLVASLVAASPPQLSDRIAMLTDLVRDGVISGIHLEGPWLAASRCGAHDPALLRDPDPDELNRVLALGNDSVRMVTVAPELPGGLAAIARITESGAVAAVGHTDASYSRTRAAIEAGATVATHLFNAMRPIHHREPGPIIALLDDPRVTVELIADGVHVAAALYRHILCCAGPERVSLITDAMAAAGMSDGAYRIGALAVDVKDGVAHVAGTDTIAGSTATMDRIFRYAVANCGLSDDKALLLGVAQTAVNPARALGFPSPVLRSGGPADLVILDPCLQVVGVIRDGIRCR